MRLFQSCCHNNCKKVCYAKLYRFPEDLERRRLWAERSGNPRIWSKSPMEMKNLYLCQLHFEDTQFCDNNKTELISGACPVPYVQADVESSPSHGLKEPASQRKQVTLATLFWLLLQLLLLLVVGFADIALDLYGTIQLWNAGELLHAISTIFIVVCGGVVNFVTNFKMDHSSSPNCSEQCDLFRLMVWMLQLPPVLRYCESLRFALKSRSAAKKGDERQQLLNYERMKQERRKGLLLGVNEIFMESAPQLILKISYKIKMVLLSGGTVTDIARIIGLDWWVVLSFASIVHNLCLFQRKILRSSKKPESTACTRTDYCIAFLYMGHLCMAVSRILTWSILAYIFSFMWTSVLMIMQWMLVLYVCISSAYFQSESWKPLLPRSCFPTCFPRFCAGGISSLSYLYSCVNPGGGKLFHLKKPFFLVFGSHILITAFVWMYLYVKGSVGSTAIAYNSSVSLLGSAVIANNNTLSSSPVDVLYTTLLTVLVFSLALMLIGLVFMLQYFNSLPDFNDVPVATEGSLDPNALEMTILNPVRGTVEPDTMD